SPFLVDIITPFNLHLIGFHVLDLRYVFAAELSQFIEYQSNFLDVLKHIEPLGISPKESNKRIGMMPKSAKDGPIISEPIKDFLVGGRSREAIQGVTVISSLL